MPNDGSRTNHRLRADMRRYADDDEVDLVVVGAGAGGGVLTQRLARAGWSVVLPRRRPVLGPRHRLGQRRARLARTVLDRAPPDRRRRPGAARAPTTPAAASAARWCTTPATRRGFTRRTSTPHSRRRRRRRLADLLRRPAARTTSRSSRAARRRAGLAVGRPAHATRTAPHPVGGNGQIVPARRAARWASRRGSGRSPSPTAASATARTASTAASACRAARSTPRPAR